MKKREIIVIKKSVVPGTSPSKRSNCFKVHSECKKGDLVKISLERANSTRHVLLKTKLEDSVSFGRTFLRKEPGYSIKPLLGNT